MSEINSSMIEVRQRLRDLREEVERSNSYLMDISKSLENIWNAIYYGDISVTIKKDE